MSEKRFDNHLNAATPERNRDHVPETSRKWIDTVASFRTAHGSVYTVLPDGKIQRFKTNGAEFMDGDKQKKPFELIAFLPNWDTIAANAPEDVLAKLGNTQEAFLANFATKFRGSVTGYKGYIIDALGKKIRTTQDLLETEGRIWAIIVKEGENNEKIEPYTSIPLHKEPELGRSTVEMNRIFNEDGSHMTERHVGNTIVEITYNDENNE